METKFEPLLIDMRRKGRYFRWVKIIVVLLGTFQHFLVAQPYDFAGSVCQNTREDRVVIPPIIAVPPPDVHVVGRRAHGDDDIVDAAPSGIRAGPEATRYPLDLPRRMYQSAQSSGLDGGLPVSLSPHTRRSVAVPLVTVKLALLGASTLPDQSSDQKSSS